MRHITLTRLESTDHGTFGKINIGNVFFYTGELPWRENASNISCIPKGIYGCKLTMSNRFKRKMYLVSNVEGRSGIRIHSANFMGDKSKGFLCHLNGCIALGEKIGIMNGQKALLVSAPAVNEFVKLLNFEEFILEVK